MQRVEHSRLQRHGQGRKEGRKEGRKVSMCNEERAYEKAGSKGRSDTFRSTLSSFPVMYNAMV